MEKLGKPLNLLLKENRMSNKHKYKIKEFPKEFMKNLAYDEQDETVKVLKREQVDSRRWMANYEVVFEFEGFLYMSNYDMGLTENQENEPYEYDPDMIECTLVEAYEKTITYYKPIKLN